MGVIQADPESFDEWEKTEIVRHLEWPGPQVPPVNLTEKILVGREGVVKVGDGSNVP